MHAMSRGISPSPPAKVTLRASEWSVGAIAAMGIARSANRKTGLVLAWPDVGCYRDNRLGCHKNPIPFAGSC